MKDLRKIVEEVVDECPDTEFTITDGGRRVVMRRIGNVLPPNPDAWDEIKAEKGLTEGRGSLGLSG